MKWNVKHLLVATSIAGMLAACENKTEQTASPKASVSPEAAKTAVATKPAEAPAAAPEKPKGVPVTDFLAKLAPTTCSWIDQCKNEKFKVVTSTMGMMIAGMGAMDKPELGKKLQGIGDAMKTEKRAFPNKQECETIGGVVLQLAGMTPEIIQAKVGKTVQYDEAKGAACLAALEKPLAACATEVKLTGEPKLSELDGFEKEFKGDLDSQTKVCEEALSGMVEAGGACEYEFECKGANAKCKGAAGAKKCEAGKAEK